MTNKHLYHGHPKLEGGGGTEGGRGRGDGRRGEGGREGGEGGKRGGGREGKEGGRREEEERVKKKKERTKKGGNLFLIFPFLYCVIFFRYLSETEDGNFINVGRASCINE